MTSIDKRLRAIGTDAISSFMSAWQLKFPNIRPQDAFNEALLIMQSAVDELYTDPEHKKFERWIIQYANELVSLQMDDIT